MERLLKRNIPALFLFSFLGESFFIVPALIPFFHSKNLSTTEIMIVQSVFHVVVLFWEIPSGYIADVIGRKKSLLAGAVLFTAGLCVYAFSSHFILFCAAEMICGLGWGLRSGADSALLYDSLAYRKKESLYHHLEGLHMSWARVGSAVAAIGGGLFALISLRFPFYVNVVTGLCMILSVLFITEPPRVKESVRFAFHDIIRITKKSLLNSELRPLMLTSAILRASGTIGIWSYFLYYERSGISVGYFGALFCVFQLSAALGGRLSARITKAVGHRRAWALYLFIGVSFAVLSRAHSLFFFPLIALNGFLWNCSLPMVFREINHRAHSSYRATVLSVSSMLGSVSFAILSPVFGRIVDTVSLSAGYLFLAAVVIVPGIPLLIKTLPITGNTHR